MSEMTFDEWQAMGAANGWNTGGVQEFDSFKDIADAPANIQEAFREAAKILPVFPINTDCTHPNTFTVGGMTVSQADENTDHPVGDYDVMRCPDCTKADWLVEQTNG